MPRYPEIPDHPEIACALRTGYPRQIRYVRCADCGKQFSGDHKMYLSDGDLICGGCLRDRILENYDDDDLAEAFGMEKTTACEMIENEEDYYAEELE